MSPTGKHVTFSRFRNASLNASVIHKKQGLVSPPRSLPPNEGRVLRRKVNHAIVKPARDLLQPSEDIMRLIEEKRRSTDEYVHSSTQHSGDRPAPLDGPT